MDHVLPTPEPDWDNPQPYDGPTHEETAAFGELRATADAIRSWVTNAYLYPPGPEGWIELGKRFRAAAAMCDNLSTDLQRTVPEVEQ